MALPLEGVRILDMTIVWAGPYGTLLLGDMGAELVRVESLQHPDVNTRGQLRIPASALEGPIGNGYPNRDPGPRPWERTATFNYAGRNKRSVTMDLTRPRGREMFLRLVAKCDALIENNAAGTLEKLGLTYETLRQANPSLVMVSLPGYGLTGPYKYFKGYGANVEAITGHTLLRGYPDMDPTATYAVYHADAAAGAAGAFALVAALHHRRHTGEGQLVDLSQGEIVVNQLPQAFMDYAMNGRVQETLGNRDPSIAPQGVYRCAGADDWIAVSVEDDRQWTALCGAIGRPELATDARFADVVSRKHNEDAADAVIQEWAASRDHIEAMHTLQAAGVTAAAVLTPLELLRDPHLRQRGFFQNVDAPHLGGAFDFPGPSFALDGERPRIRRPAPTLGQDNEYVYKEIIGVSDEEYADLVRDKHIGSMYTVFAQPE